jgi:nitroreductase/FMN reductase [NAD(P)H]
MSNDAAATLKDALSRRFGEDIPVDPSIPGLDELVSIASHSTHRRFQPKPVSSELLRLLCACALSAPSKSDLQQGDIVIIDDQTTRREIEALLPDMPWMASAPVFLVFLANGRRVPRLAQMRGKPFPNNHLDMFFNAAVDSAIVLTNFLRAAEAVGLGCCPISVIRDHCTTVSRLLDLPERVIPVAGMCVGWPADQAHITARLSLDTTVHHDRFKDDGLAAEVDAYDRRRHAIFAYRRQRDPARWGEAAFYGWSEDKARQYAVPTRTDFGAFVRGKGFRLD